MKLHNDIKQLKKTIQRKVSKAANARQQHFDNVARQMGYADSNIAFSHLGKAFIEKAKVNAPSIKSGTNIK